MSSPADFNLVPATEMDDLGRFLQQAVQAKTDPQSARQLQQDVKRYQATSESTASLYWSKFIDALSTLLAKLVGVHNPLRQKGTFFDEKIQKRKFVSRLGEMKEGTKAEEKKAGGGARYPITKAQKR